MRYLIKNGILVTVDSTESEQHAACQYASSKLMAERLMDTLPSDSTTVNNRAALAHTVVEPVQLAYQAGMNNNAVNVV